MDRAGFAGQYFESVRFFRQTEAVRRFRFDEAVAAGLQVGHEELAFCIGAQQRMDDFAVGADKPELGARQLLARVIAVEFLQCDRTEF